MERKPTRQLTRSRLRRVLLGALAAVCLVCSFACQTPPKKPNSSLPTVRHNGVNSQSASALNSFDLFSSSAELFGTDPRASRPALVSTTAFAAVGGAAALLAGAVIVSAARAARGRTSSRRGRSRSA